MPPSEAILPAERNSSTSPHEVARRKREPLGGAVWSPSLLNITRRGNAFAVGLPHPKQQHLLRHIGRCVVEGVVA
eukprot:11925257-Alexandrium_andersonii.AAC.1